MNKSLNTLALAAATLALAAAQPAFAESQYGFASSGTGAVTATARVNLAVTVPKLILLRVGTTTAGGDTLSWASAFNIPPTPTNGDNQAYAWAGTAPTTSTTNPAAIPVFAWTNGAGGGSLSYTATAFATGGPSLSDISVTASTGPGTILNHPTPAALATVSTAPSTFATTTLAGGSWSYALTGTPATWQAGTYTSTVTYTATSL